MTGLKPSQIKAVNRLYFRRFVDLGAYSNEQARELAILTADLGRQIGLIIDRRGTVVMVIIGDQNGILIPELNRYRQSKGRLSGLRLLHSHIGSALLSQEDLMDMVFLRLDSIAVLSTDGSFPQQVQWAQLLPPNPENQPYMLSEPMSWERCQVDFPASAQSLEDELARTGQTLNTDYEEGCALLVSVGTASRQEQEAGLQELADLADTAGLDAVGRVVQRVHKLNPKHILGKGKLAELEVQALQHNAATILFNQELSPTQQRNLSLITERKVLDRTQLILDIFAQHASSKAGKLQVEMAQLKYMLPRLVGQNRALSRLAGGIGGRGPGETKLELSRRKARDRINHLQKELSKVKKHREATRSRRHQAQVPVVALVGYTNAGKSTLLNTLTHSSVLAENKLFATLDPTSRRLRFPQDKEILLTDTVGFIRELPQELQQAFMATLEELSDAQLLIQVADASHIELEQQVKAVDEILHSLDLHEISKVLVLNKWDKIDSKQKELLINIFPGAISASALDRGSLHELVECILQKTFGKDLELNL